MQNVHTFCKLWHNWREGVRNAENNNVVLKMQHMYLTVMQIKILRPGGRTFLYSLRSVYLSDTTVGYA